MSNRCVIFSRELLEFLGGTLVSEKCKKGTIAFTTDDLVRENEILAGTEGIGKLVNAG